MESCLLCLELNKDMLDCISANATRWLELDITKTVEKHFWSLNIQPSSWICLLCWREVEDFHKFYLRIEEAHANFGNIKVKNGDSDRDNKALCNLEAETQIDQEEQWTLIEPEIITEHSPVREFIVDKHTEINKPAGELDCDDVPLEIACEQVGLESKDPLGKSCKSKKKKNTKSKLAIEELKTEDFKTNVDLNDNSQSTSNNFIDAPDTNEHKDSSAERKRRRANNKHHPNRKDNDKFIADHFKYMFCDLCKASFRDFPDMQKHFTETHKQRGYVVCCKRKFSDRTRLVDHLHCHLNPDHFKCTECGKTMSDRIKFDNHMMRVHRTNEVIKQHCCDVCGKSFREAYVLRTHKLTHLPEEEKKFPCIDCGKNYGSSYLLNQHRQVVHLKRFVKVCYICGKKINSCAEFRAHMNKHEGIPPPVIHCDVCGLRLTSERGLKVHKESQHPVGGKQKHPCHLCDKISPTVRALRKHINTMHEKGFDHKCTLCEKAFRRAEALKEHIASHTGTPLYACPWCAMTFKSNGNMHAHRKNKHPKEYLEQKLQNYSFPPAL